jgi:hypothetical protein
MRTTCAPDAVEPRSANVAPISFKTILATKLSLSAVISGRMCSRRCERSKAMGKESAGARPAPGRPSTAIPRLFSASINARAAAAADPFTPANESPPTESADSGRDSTRGRTASSRALPSRVEVRVVTEHATFDPPDPSGRDAACEPVQIRPGEGRVAEPDEEEVASPRAPCPGADAHDLGMEAKARAEHVQRGERDPELLDRRRQE